MGPTGLLGLNVAVKQRLVLKQECLRRLISQALLKMLILSGLKEPAALTVATPLDLKTEYNKKKLISDMHERVFLVIKTVTLTRAAPLCRKHQQRCQGVYRHSDPWHCLKTFQNTATSDPDWSPGSSGRGTSSLSMLNLCSWPHQSLPYLWELFM